MEIDTIEHLTVATTAAAENEAAKSARASELAAAKAALEAEKARRAEELDAMWEDIWADRDARADEIERRQREIDAYGQDEEEPYIPEAGEYTGLDAELGGIGEDVAAIRKSVNAADEDLKSLVDVAERRYINRINLTSQAPVIQITGQNTGRTAQDRQALADAIQQILLEQWASGSVRSTATP